MALAKRSAAFNHGLDKKTDLPVHTSNSTWHPSTRMRPWTLLRRKRFLLTFLGLFCVYLFVRYLPTDVPSVGLRIDPRTGRTQGYPLNLNPNSQHSGAGRYPASGEGQVLDQLYDGPVKFYHLATSLRPHLQRMDVRADHVVFLLRDLRVLPSYLPLACEMAIHNRTMVHVAVMTLQDNSIEEILAVGGIDATDCPVFWHDARPDYNLLSSLTRRVAVINAALGHIDAVLKPSVVIIDKLQAGDRHFQNTVRDKLNSLRIPLNIVPTDAMKSMAWIAGLSGPSLALLNQIRIDIVITPYKQSAGSLLRLLKSIQEANYSGLFEPRITIELPQYADRQALQYLEYLQWPVDQETGQSKLILRRRMDKLKLSPAAASVRMLESFYPAAWPMSHVLVIEPDVELSPDYLQYLTYMALEYKHGIKGVSMADSVMGISLDLPETGVDEQTSFVEPAASGSETLLWSQSPSSTAALYFGDKWVELQDWTTQRLQHDPRLEKKIAKSSTVVSTKHPAWLSLAQELMHARNYLMLYPGFAKTREYKMVTVHSEAHQDPEEFAKVLAHDSKDKSSGRPEKILAISNNDILTAEDGSMHAPSHVMSSPPRSLPVLLLGKEHAQDRAQLPDDYKLPTYGSNGRKIDASVASSNAVAFGDRVSLELGGCTSLEERDETLRGHVEYFFCQNV